MCVFADSLLCKCHLWFAYGLDRVCIFGSAVGNKFISLLSDILTFIITRRHILPLQTKGALGQLQDLNDQIIAYTKLGSTMPG